MSTLTAPTITRPAVHAGLHAGLARPAFSQAGPIVGRNHRRPPSDRARPTGRGTTAPLASRPVARPLVRPTVRAAAVVVALVLGLFLFVSLGGLSRADAPAAPLATVVVQPGDTVWDIAAAHAPAGTSTADYAWLVATHNDVQATALRPGTVLQLPARP